MSCWACRSDDDCFNLSIVDARYRSTVEPVNVQICDEEQKLIMRLLTGLRERSATFTTVGEEPLPKF